MSTSQPASPVRAGVRPAALLALAGLAVAVIAVQYARTSSTSSAGLAPPGDPAAPAAAILDDTDPSVANLDAALRAALGRATGAAADDGVELVVNSGWRSAREQERLLRAAIERYGSRAEAARWVAGPTTSAHVTGDAVDIGPPPGAAWLSAHGAAYGLCQIYANEPWHFELRPDAVATGCPPRYADPTEDPRMRR
ncbi:M15 family metallopeptidase [Nocardia rhizosphaerae]|uniref:M15 family metallopeptidase n=1 Tax=Nocardia rhizosphaerae TaxID=1691571 RepID=A0ABV8LDQ2_9NOCA